MRARGGEEMVLGALEAGGTKMACAVGDETGKILDRMTIPTDLPSVTVPRMAAYFGEHGVAALGIGCFGPLELREHSPRYGYITSTPKSGWRDYDIVGAFSGALRCPIGFDTDVNAAVLGEVAFGQARGMDCAVYVTVGTGIGAGIYIEGKLLHGMLHPEAGHVPVRRRKDDRYAGNCPYHRDCLEGLASGPAIEARWGEKAELLADRPEVWELEADYLAQALAGYILTLSPQIIILGGGVMRQEQLFPMIRQKTADLLGGYLQAEELRDMDRYIVPAGLRGDQGVMGCLELARRAYDAGCPEKKKKSIHL